VAVVVCVAAVWAAPAAAQDPYAPPTKPSYHPDPHHPAPSGIDRHTFVRRADAICGPVFHRVRPKLKEGVEHLQHQQWVKAADDLLPAYRALHKVYGRVADLNRPSRDAERIGRWLDLKLRQFRVGVNAIKAYGAVRLNAAQRLTHRSLRLAGKAARVVDGWGFRRCR
jgi:hypothetical protein